MSKLNDILDMLLPQVDYNPGILPDEAGYDVDKLEEMEHRSVHREEAAIKTKALFLELIGEDDEPDLEIVRLAPSTQSKKS